jgi:cyclohexa-1,5-dienecarbonyl-CoA hydratase
MMREMNEALEELEREIDTKLLVIAAQGKAFSAGVDIKDHTPDKVEEMIEVFHGIFRRLLSLEIPTLAVVQGACLGGGCELASFCDFIIASEEATFGQPEIKVGVFPPIAVVLFPYLVGQRKSLELLLTGEVVDAREAERIGLVTRVVPPEELARATEELVARLVGLSGVVLRLTKRAIYEAVDLPFGKAMEHVERLYLEGLMGTEDAKEGLQAFLEKRKPVWRNR